MESQRIRGIIATGLLLLGASLGFAQEKLRFQIGDQVEFYSAAAHTPTNWGKGTIIGVETNGNHKGPYHVHFDGRPDNEQEWLRVYEVRSRPGKNAQFNVGDRVDVYFANHPPTSGKGRGTVLEVGDSRYKIHFDGCKAYLDGWEDRMSVRPEATISAGDPEIKFLIGNWAMFTPSYPNTVVRGDNVYRQYGMGAKSPPVQINADGTYVWHFDFGKPPVRGKWKTHSKVGERIESEGTSRSVTDSGLVIKDPSGQEWKVYRWTMPDGKDRITAQLMCSGESMIGSRIR